MEMRRDFSNPNLFFTLGAKAPKIAKHNRGNIPIKDGLKCGISLATIRKRSDKEVTAALKLSDVRMIPTNISSCPLLVLGVCVEVFILTIVFFFQDLPL